MIHAAYRSIVAFLVWLSAEPGAVDLERPRAAAAVHTAAASLAREQAPPAPTPPAPTPGKCCGDCGGTGVLVMPDGHRVPCPCPATCPCKAGRDMPAALPTPAAPAVP